MTYIWKCNMCGHRVEVRRSMHDCMVKPDTIEGLHENCESTEFTRVYTSPMAVHVHENEAQYWNDDNYRE